MSLVMNIHCFLFFPLFLYKWRGAGLVVYLLLLFFAGLPIFYMEILVGLYLRFRYWAFVCRPKAGARVRKSQIRKFLGSIRKFLRYASPQISLD
jgi:hypothetical protein